MEFTESVGMDIALDATPAPDSNLKASDDGSRLFCFGSDSFIRHHVDVIMSLNNREHLESTKQIRKVLSQRKFMSIFMVCAIVGITDI